MQRLQFEFSLAEISNGKKQNAYLRPRRRAEQDEPREQRENRCSGSHGGRFEERFKGKRGEKRQRGRRKCGGRAANCSFFSFETVFLLLFICGHFSSLVLFPRPISATT
jgi:hypothetical protein